MDPLEIIISAVDEASATFGEVGASMETLASDMQAVSAEIDADFQTMNESLAEFGLEMDSTTGQIEIALMSQEQSFQMAAAVAQQSDQEIIDVMLATASTADEAAATIAEANSLIATSSEEASAASSGAGGAGAYGGMAVVGGIAFASITAGISNAVKSATQWNTESAIIANNLKLMGSSIPLSAIQNYAVQVQNTTLMTQQQALETAGLITNYKDLAPHYQSLTMLTADLATKMSQTSGTMADNMPKAAQMLTNALENPVQGMSQLIRQAGIALPAAEITMMQHMAQAGDTAGTQAMILKALNDSIAGLAVTAAGAPGAALIQLSNQMTALGTAIGKDLLPLLDMLAVKIEPIVKDVIAWTAAHPKLTDAIVIGSVALAALLLAVGLLGVAILTFTPVIALATTIITGFSVAALMAALPFVVLGVLIAAFVIIVATHLNELKADFAAILPLIQIEWENFWNMVFTFGDKIMQVVKNDIHTLLVDIQKDWIDIWTQIGGFFKNIWDTIISDLKTAINNVISIIDDLISGINALHIDIPAITIPGTKIGTPAVNLGFDIPTIPHLAEGGIVSLPTVALIGESGPEAVVPLGSTSAASYGGATQGQQIIINIQGGNYLDKQGADMIAQALVLKIQRNIKLKSI